MNWGYVAPKSHDSVGSQGFFDLLHTIWRTIFVAKVLFSYNLSNKFNLNWEQDIKRSIWTIFCIYLPLDNYSALKKLTFAHEFLQKSNDLWKLISLASISIIIFSGTTPDLAMTCLQTRRGLVFIVVFWNFYLVCTQIFKKVKFIWKPLVITLHLSHCTLRNKSIYELFEAFELKIPHF